MCIRDRYSLVFCIYIKLPLYYLGDSAYPTSRTLIKPYLNPEDPRKRLFNRKLSGIRTIATENSIGILKQRLAKALSTRQAYMFFFPQGFRSSAVEFGPRYTMPSKLLLGPSASTTTSSTLENLTQTGQWKKKKKIPTLTKIFPMSMMLLPEFREKSIATG